MEVEIGLLLIVGNILLKTKNKTSAATTSTIPTIYKLV
jgi:hypothetical protein